MNNKRTGNNGGTANKRISRKNRRKRVLIVILLIISIPLIGYLWLVVSFSGGIDGVINNLKPAPDPKSASITEKRNTIKRDIDAELDQLERSFMPSQTANSIYDTCYEGQNNWKIHDGYAHRCDYRVTRYYGFNGDFRQKMLDLEQELFKLKWQASNGAGNQLGNYIRNYYDRYYGSKDPQVIAYFGGAYFVSDLPTVINGYSKNDIGMDIAYGEKDSKDNRGLEAALGFSKRGSPIFESKDFINVRSIIAGITKDNKYVIAISLEKNYFQD